MRHVTNWVLLAVFTMAITSIAEKTRAVNASDYATRMEVLKAETREQITALEVQLESLASADQQAIQLQITDLKRNAEIARLQILLEWATAENDKARISEVTQALDNLLNPPVQNYSPEDSHDKEVAPGQDKSTGK